MEVIHSGREISNSQPNIAINESQKGPKRHLIQTKTVDVSDLTDLQMKRMYQIFSKYYAGHTEEQFVEDMLEKSVVIILFNKIDLTIQGFSTILNFQSQLDGQKYIGIYSGDTILERDYWGSSALGKAFLAYLWKQKIKSPHISVYWFLISKGYKTYLLMANNFKEHYPRYESTTPTKHRQLMSHFYKKKFPETYFHDQDLIIPKSQSCHLKNYVAYIKEDLIKNPRVKFFQEKNPGWQNGNELCCIAKMTFLLPLKYALKKFIRRH